MIGPPVRISKSCSGICSPADSKENGLCVFGIAELVRILAA